MAASLEEEPGYPMDIENIVSTPTGHVSSINMEELSGTMRSVSLEETPKSRRPQSSRVPMRLGGKVLFRDVSPGTKESTSRLPNWAEEEVKCLIGFLMLYTDGQSWVAHKDSVFWGQAGVYIQQQAKTLYCRSGKYG